MKTISTITILLLALLTASGTINANDTLQVKKKIALNDISCNGIISGDGFGMQYVPSIGIRFGKRTVICAGPMFNPNWKNDGYVISTRYLLIRENESYSGHLILSINLSFERFNATSLSSAFVRNESLASDRMQTDGIPAFAKIRYSGWECASGFGLNYRLRCGMIFKTEVGFSYIDSYQKTPQIFTIRQNHGMSLRLGAGIGWKFGKMMSKQEHESEMMKEQGNGSFVEQN